VNCCVPPTVRLDEVGEIASDVTGTALTAIAPEPLRPLYFAVTVADPADTPVARPDEALMVATDEEMLHAAPVEVTPVVDPSL
jgi:hypothetical protein